MTRPTISGTREALRRGHYIRVVNYHSTPRSLVHNLDHELAAYARDFTPVSAEDIDRFFDTGRWHKDRPGILPVFYEGYRNSAEVAAPLCEEHGLIGWFPIATAFIDCDERHQEAFARSHWIELADEDTRGGRIAMNWDDVAQLAGKHVVLPHTAHHEGFDTVTSDEDLQREVVEPKRQIETVIGRPVDHFVWLHGSAYGQSERHDQAVKAAGYRYQFSNTTLYRIS